MSLGSPCPPHAVSSRLVEGSLSQGEARPSRWSPVARPSLTRAALWSESWVTAAPSALLVEDMRQGPRMVLGKRNPALHEAEQAPAPRKPRRKGKESSRSQPGSPPSPPCPSAGFWSRFLPASQGSNGPSRVRALRAGARCQEAAAQVLSCLGGSAACPFSSPHCPAPAHPSFLLRYVR